MVVLKPLLLCRYPNLASGGAGWALHELFALPASGSKASAPQLVSGGGREW